MYSLVNEWQVDLNRIGAKKGEGQNMWRIYRHMYTVLRSM